MTSGWRRMLCFAALPLAGLLIGIVVAIASSPRSLSPDRYGGLRSISPSPAPLDVSPPPTVTTPGVLGDTPRLLASGSSNLVGLGSNLALVSTDGGKTWAAMRPPTNGTGIAVNAANPRSAIAGGSNIRFTTDGGATWKTTLTNPPGKGPYQPLAVGSDGNVWYFLHQTRLLRTRDGSQSWAELSGLPPLTNPVLVGGQIFGQFFLAVGNRVFQLIDNGQQISEEPPVPQGSVSELAVVDGARPVLLARAGTSGVFAINGTTWATAGGGLAGPVAGGAANTMVVGNGGNKLGSRGLVSYSANGGLTWSPAIGLPYDQTVEALAGQPGSNTFFAYCYGGDVYTSTDGGHVWTLLTRALRTTSG